MGCFGLTVARQQQRRAGMACVLLHGGYPHVPHHLARLSRDAEQWQTVPGRSPCVVNP
jgi:hypothetical protein